jgi:hypothetical protein
LATVRFSTFPGAREQDIVQAVGSATATSNIELTVDLGNTMESSSRVLTKQEVIYSLKRLIDFLVHGGTNQIWPPQ